ncbi:hypothetical protein OAT84_02470 [Gammaproteobacteria bacterium]|nr:hypothetical protein [Gammaproteobacteria bacterium]
MFQRVLEDLHNSSIQSYELKTNLISINDLELTERINWTTQTPSFSASPMAIPYFSNANSCLRTPVVSAMTILALLGSDGKVVEKIPATLYSIPLKPLERFFSSNDLKFTQLQKSDLYNKLHNIYHMPHGGFLFGGPGEKIEDIISTEASNQFPPHDCTSIITAAITQ